MKNARSLLIYSLLGSLLGMLSDWALLYDPAGGYLLQPKFEFLKSLPVERIWFGHFLGGLSIPISLLALPALFEAIKANSEEKFKITSFIFGVTIFGIVYHLSILPFRLWLDLGQVVLPFHLGVYQVIEAICGLGILTLGIGWFKYAGRFPTLQHARIWANPVLTYLIWIGCFAINSDWGGMVWMAGMNLSVLICQLTLIGVVWK